MSKLINSKNSGLKKVKKLNFVRDNVFKIDNLDVRAKKAFNYL